MAGSGSPAGMLGNTGGSFQAGTVKRSGLNMYDTAASTFHATPDGPYEESAVSNQGTAQRHFNSTREIKLKDTYGLPLPVPTYKDHYPPKGPLPQDTLPESLTGPGTGAPFIASTEYDNQFWDKPRANRPVEPLSYTHKPAPWIQQQTTNQATYKPLPPNAGGTVGPTRQCRPATQPPQMPNIYETTYGREHTPKQGQGRQPTGLPERRAYPPWLAGPTTYNDHYVPKELALQLVLDPEANQPYPFSGITEHQDQFTPKEGYPVQPPLTGIVARAGLQLPLPRRSLGVEFVHRGVSDKYFVLIPRTAANPCSARQVFTTVHDNQETACILILYGDDPVASNNILLGQFDIMNIPPAPKDVPRIEVMFHLDGDCYLTVEARDMDTERHKLWQQRGDIIVLRA